MFGSVRHSTRAPASGHACGGYRRVRGAVMTGHSLLRQPSYGVKTRSGSHVGVSSRCVVCSLAAGSPAALKDARLPQPVNGSRDAGSGRRGGLR